MDTLQRQPRSESGIPSLGFIFLVSAVAASILAKSSHYPYAHLGPVLTLFGSASYYFLCSFRLSEVRDDHFWSSQFRLVESLLSWGALVAFSLSAVAALILLLRAWQEASIVLAAYGLLSVPGPIIAWVVRRKTKRGFSHG
jgi:hypothetical protein